MLCKYKKKHVLRELNFAKVRTSPVGLTERHFTGDHINEHDG